MSQRIFNALRKVLNGREYTRDELLQMSEELDISDPMVLRVQREANLEIADETESVTFCHQKVFHDLISNGLLIVFRWHHI